MDYITVGIIKSKVRLNKLVGAMYSELVKLVFLWSKLKYFFIKVLSFKITVPEYLAMHVR